MTYVVEIILAEDGDLVQRMSEMRTWFDSERVEPTMFRYFQRLEGLRISVEFPVEGEATAFAEKFEGRLLARARGKEHKDVENDMFTLPGAGADASRGGFRP